MQSQQGGSTLYKKTLWWVCAAIFSSITIFWVERTISRYNSKPVTSVVSIKRNESFTWPALSICPDERCYNEEAVKDLSKHYNISRDNSADPELFKLTTFTSKFDLNRYNYSDIVTKARFINRTSIISDCKYVSIRDSAELYNLTMCFDDVSAYHKWSTYNTRFAPCFKFVPTIPAKELWDYARIAIDTTVCNKYDIGIHPSVEIYYRHSSSTVKEYIGRKGYSIEFRFQAKVYDSINRKSSPCVEDNDYSQSLCNEMRIKDQVMKEAGCYFRAVTGPPKDDNYPECNNLTAYRKMQNIHRPTTSRVALFQHVY